MKKQQMEESELAKVWLLKLLETPQREEPPTGSLLLWLIVVLSLIFVPALLLFTAKWILK